jgi:hypothetical protein
MRLTTREYFKRAHDAAAKERKHSKEERRACCQAAEAERQREAGEPPEKAAFNGQSGRLAIQPPNSMGNIE